MPGRDCLAVANLEGNGRIECCSSDARVLVNFCWPPSYDTPLYEGFLVISHPHASVGGVVLQSVFELIDASVQSTWLPNA
ncbi:hypothetical protein HBI56_024520 [Parastagonospora nodorum]|uniref:Uncharacterized protein n=1 Tax=Phaeosphaeria nodorum (strain SN15 / ATCC MYA-4574 / FGSC 10173) TaxID=321614 RepID=A0A7U2I0H8_PHANO|nr:hypothetical protein HBH56_024020 [Parastagonospora nodorum]QRC98760.1 hypothetical protein JI435_412510 [Parastagonospora nodorum SN15]KAH3934654.1 hypothetical protein HBH54_058010 [Parastagonospora nodorum]KAH3949649.1 hypothetical protein HBH53_085710 [Parastagonospora nodorum]KAH4039372.1 hypothetical protein HBI09_047420 [Parastagonospora nodorum]